MSRASQPDTTPQVDATILICTYNRASYLGGTLDSIGATPADPGFSWDVLVVDNNSSRRHSRGRRERAARDIPVPLRYLFEGRQGKSNALNTGMSAAHAAIIVFTDDDVAGRDRSGSRRRCGRCSSGRTSTTPADRSGRSGSGPRPHGSIRSGNLGGTIAVKDHGPDAFVFEDRAQDAARRQHGGPTVADRTRSAGSVPTSDATARRCSARNRRSSSTDRARPARAGLYVPAMVLDHVVPAARLTRSYFRRWWYWKGVSHARVHQLHGRTELEHRRPPRAARARRPALRLRQHRPECEGVAARLAAAGPGEARRALAVARLLRRLLPRDLAPHDARPRDGAGTAQTGRRSSIGVAGRSNRCRSSCRTGTEI